MNAQSCTTTCEHTRFDNALVCCADADDDSGTSFLANIQKEQRRLGNLASTQPDDDKASGARYAPITI